MQNARAVKVVGLGTIALYNTPTEIDLTAAAYLTYSGEVPRYVYLALRVEQDLTNEEGINVMPIQAGDGGDPSLEGLMVTTGSAVVLNVIGFNALQAERSTASATMGLCVVPVEPVFND